MVRHRQAVEEYGLSDRYGGIRRRSVDLFYLYLKDTFERARSSPTLDGYAYWLMTDIPGGVEGDMNPCGILDPLYKPDKFADPEALLRFNSETVLFCDAGPDRRVLGGDEARPVSVGISHYGANWSLTAGSWQACLRTGAGGGELPRSSRVRPPTSRRWTWRYHPRAMDTPSVRQAGCLPATQPGLVFPAQTGGTGPGIANLTEGRSHEAMGRGCVPQRAVVITDHLSGALLGHLERGGTVILLTERGGLQPLRHVLAGVDPGRQRHRRIPL
jgi:hypothetical protein